MASFSTWIVETRHLAVRLAWHDSGWNGTVCADPGANTKYCTAPGSLLAGRIHRRIDLDLEKKFRGRPIQEIVKEGYLPPCYWSINAAGKHSSRIADPHPFTDASRNTGRFRSVPPLEYDLDPFSAFTWPFAIGYARSKKSESRYEEPDTVRRRIASYVDHLQGGSSVAFTYCTPNNPVTGDERRPLLVGAGLISRASMPKDYAMSPELVSYMRAQPGMKNFPESAWQFKVNLDQGCTVMLPYREYLHQCESARDFDEEVKRQEALKAMSVPVADPVLLPHFKYVSMHIPDDKALYILYTMKRSVKRMRDDGVVGAARLDAMEEKIGRMLEVVWRERGRYPGIGNMTVAMLQNDLTEDALREVASRMVDAARSQSDIGAILSALAPGQQQDANSSQAAFDQARRILGRRQGELEFFARLDLSAPQAARIVDRINNDGSDGLMENPYLLAERRACNKNDWDANELDCGLSLYQIDMAMLPDPDYATWEYGLDAKSPARLGAAVAEILADNADETGSTYMMRDGVAKGLEEYPLYYIQKELRIGRNQLKTLEHDPLFTSAFAVSGGAGESGDTLYQLRGMRRMEESVEEFVEGMLAKSHKQGDPWQDKDLSKHALARLPPEEVSRRKAAYTAALSGGLFVLSGKAGTGKTDAIAAIIRRLRKDGVEPIYVVTPTGKAALVITARLKKDGQLGNGAPVEVSTIDRLLHVSVGKRSRTPGLYKNYKDSLGDFLEMGPSRFDKLRESASKVQITPRALIIDEATMVDQKHMAALFSVVSRHSLRNLIIAGDERQLPPIEYGSPFTDIIHHLKSTNREDRHVRLEGNLRFGTDTALGGLAALFEDDKEPSLPEIRHAVARAEGGGADGTDGTLSLSYFDDAGGLEKVMSEHLSAIAGRGGQSSAAAPVRALIEEIIAGAGAAGRDLDRIQILSPRRVGPFGTAATNQRIDERWPSLGPGAKVICVKNMYMDAWKGQRKFRVLGLANGSMGHVGGDGTPHFADLEDNRRDFDSMGDWILKKEIGGGDAAQDERGERSLALGYTITVHRAQGSGFDHVLLVLSDMGRFMSRELLYTALTRARQDLHLLVKGDLRERLPQLLSRAFANSATVSRKTLMFGPKGSPFRSYRLSTTTRGGGTIEVRSKAEYIIAKLLDESGIDFEYEPDDLYEESRMRPDFRIAGRFYLEHLGLAHSGDYMARWAQKRAEYRRLGLEAELVTTSEGTSPDFEANVRALIEDIRGGEIKGEEGGYSLHHYVL